MDYKSPCKFTTLFRIMIPNSIFLSIFAALNDCDVLLNVPSTDTPRIQECHIMLGHILCEMVETELFPQP